MTFKCLNIPAAVLAATTFAAAPALAQRAHRGEQGRTPQADNRGQSENRGQSGNRGQAENRGQSENRGQARERGSDQRAQPRAGMPPAAPRQDPAPAPRVAPRGEMPRGGAGGVSPRGEIDTQRNRGSYAVPRVAPRVERPTVIAPRYDSRYYGGRRWDGYHGSPWYGYRGYSAFRPYFFRPWYRLGFSINVGYPVAYYAYPYAVPVYGYGAPYSQVYVGPNNTAYGGVALQIQPDDAYVYVDGGYAGIARDFDGSRQPLTLMPGTHHIEIDQNGFEPLVFDVTVQPGMVIPYQGGLRPY